MNVDVDINLSLFFNISNEHIHLQLLMFVFEVIHKFILLVQQETINKYESLKSDSTLIQKLRRKIR